MASRRKRSDDATSEPSKKAQAHVPATTAVGAVLSTAELLEAILLHLTFKDLFLLQRVSRDFRNVISGSPHIQQQMFLKPTDREPWVLRPACAQPESFDDLELVPASNATDSTEVLVSGFTPAKFSPLGQYLDFSCTTLMQRTIEVELATFDLTELVKKPGSWRGVLVTNPPCRAMIMDGTVSLAASVSSDAKEIKGLKVHARDEVGITLGAMYDAFLASEEGLRRRTTFNADLVQGFEGVVNEASQLETNGEFIGLVVMAALEDVVIPNEIEWEEISGKSNA